MSSQPSPLSLRANLVAAFSLDELKLLCGDAGIDAESIPLAERGKEVFAQEVINAFLRSGKLTSLIAQCQQQRPQVDWANLPPPELSQDAPPPAAPTIVNNITMSGGVFFGSSVTAQDIIARDKITTAAAGEGLRGLSTLKTHPEIVRGLGEAKADLRNTFEQSTLLNTFKSMHEQLHILQFDCFNFLQRGADRFSSDDSFGDLLDNFNRIVDELSDISTRPETRRTNEAQWVNQLRQALQLFRAALESTDNDQARQTYERGLHNTRTILRTRLACIDGVLRAAASNMPLGSVLKTLTAVGVLVRGLDLTELERVSAESFHTGLAALAQLAVNLVEQASAHNQWQDVDSELREIERDPVHELVAMQRWQDLQNIARPLYAEGDEPNLVQLRQLDQKLQAAITGTDPRTITKAFNDYRSRAGLCFFRVDTRLKKLCDGFVRDIHPQLGGLLN